MKPFALWLVLLLNLAYIVVGYPSVIELNDVSQSTTVTKRKSYAGYKLLRTEPLTTGNVPVFRNLEDVHGINYWTYPLENRSLDIFTSPKQLSRVQGVLKDLGLDHDVVFHDAEEIMHYEQPPQAKAKQLVWEDDAQNTAEPSDVSYQSENATGQDMPPTGTTRAVAPDFFNRYQRYNAIMNFASQLARENPSTVSFQSIGRSYEGKDMGILKIATGGSKPGIFIDGGMHAREWISPATVTYIMNKLVNDPKSKPLTDMFDWYIVPIVNVDGYEYTHTNDRYWRKTRSRSSNGCYGVDPNRNFGFHWAESGSSNKPCSDIYHGPKAFSEVETQNLGRTILYLKDKLKLYLTFHAYSQMWLVPWGFAKSQKPQDYNELVRLATVGKNALERTYGTRYSVGTAPDLLYPAAGGSDDWAKGAAGIPYSYCLELRDKGRYGFALPANQIKATGEETFNAVAAVAQELYRTLKKKEQPFTNADNESD
ncbi:Carboxypeptidase B [Orchesella cincta]|uniref:Carboxypeptidase B n=1 Tax=Orchesella cincta TaxID=48709 RepID=A0A1D2NGV0_ORCCI|nr:Carboxypeptidase B [Orchesella cincta]